MIIRQGFIRGDYGTWFNLDQIRDVYVEGVWTKDEPVMYCVMATFVDKRESEVRLSLLYDEEHRAMCVLDDVFGY